MRDKAPSPRPAPIRWERVPRHAGRGRATVSHIPRIPLEAPGPEPPRRQSNRSGDWFWMPARAPLWIVAWSAIPGRPGQPCTSARWLRSIAGMPWLGGSMLSSRRRSCHEAVSAARGIGSRANRPAVPSSISIGSSASSAVKRSLRCWSRAVARSMRLCSSPGWSSASLSTTPRRFLARQPGGRRWRERASAIGLQWSRCGTSNGAAWEQTFS